VVAVAAAAGIPLALTRGRGGAGPAVALPLTEHSLVRVDSATGRLAAATALGVSPGPVAVGAGAVWVASLDEAKLLQINPATGKVTDRVDVAEVGHPSVLAAGAGAAWLADPGAVTTRRVYRYYPDGRGLKAISTGEAPPADLAVAGGALWVGCNTLLRMLPDSGHIAEKVHLPVAAFAVGEGAVWAAGETGVGESLLWEFDPSTAAVRSKTKLAPGVVDLAAGAGAIWVVRISDDSITRVDVGTRASTEGFRVRLPEIVAAGGNAVWVTSGRDGTLTRYDATSGDLRTIDVGGPPTGLAVGHGAVWVAVAAA